MKLSAKAKSRLFTLDEPAPLEPFTAKAALRYLDDAEYLPIAYNEDGYRDDKCVVIPFTPAKDATCVDSDDPKAKCKLKNTSGKFFKTVVCSFVIFKGDSKAYCAGNKESVTWIVCG